MAPYDPDIVYLVGFTTSRSKDGGKTWESIRGNHVDYHGMWINPEDKNHAILVNDGGVMFTYDDFATFEHPSNLPIGHQFSLAATQTEGKFWLYSNIQDSGAWRGEIDMTAGRGNIAFSTVWAIAESPLKKGVIYAGTDDGNFHTTMDEGETWTLNTEGLPSGLFISSIEASRLDEGTVYITISGKRQHSLPGY